MLFKNYSLLVVSRETLFSALDWPKSERFNHCFGLRKAGTECLRMVTSRFPRVYFSANYTSCAPFGTLVWGRATLVPRKEHVVGLAPSGTSFLIRFLPRDLERVRTRSRTCSGYSPSDSSISVCFRRSSPPSVPAAHKQLTPRVNPVCTLSYSTVVRIGVSLLSVTKASRLES